MIDVTVAAQQVRKWLDKQYKLNNFIDLGEPIVSDNKTHFFFELFVGPEYMGIVTVGPEGEIDERGSTDYDELVEEVFELLDNKPYSA